MPLRQLIGGALTLRGADKEQRVHLGVRLDEMVVRGQLTLAITPSPALLPALSHLQVRFNDRLVNVIPLRADGAGERIVRKIDLDPRLFVDDNWLSLQLVGHYTLNCEDPLHNSLWAEVDVDATGFELAVRPLVLEDELALFPAPWFDRRGGGRLEVPMVLGEQPEPSRLQTAAIIASWLGSLAGDRGATFPVLRHRLPEQHAIVFATPQQPSPEGLVLPPPQGPTVRVMRHPMKPHVKLLVLQGRTDEELRTAALGLMLGRQAMSGPSAQVHSVANPPPRAPYDAPNWVATDRPVRWGELAPERTALQLHGTHPDAVRVHWRTPPDLWQGPGRNARLDLSYRVAVPSQVGTALMSVALNDSFIRAWRLEASPSTNSLGGLGRWLGVADDTTGNLRLPLPEFQPRRANTIEVRLPLGMKSQADNCAGLPEPTRASVDADSTLDFSGLPHYLDMPDLASFAETGFPFTRQADLAQTAIVLPPRPDDHEIETLLAVMGSFGRWTGMPGWHVALTTPESLEPVRDRDLLLIGGERLHELLKRWQKTPMLAMDGTQREASGFLAPVAEWRTWLPRALDTFGKPAGTEVPLRLGAQGALAIITGFESPMQAGRSVVALSGDQTGRLPWLSTALLDPAQAAQIQGGLTIVREREVRAYERTSTYHTGQLPLSAQVSLLLSRHPWATALALVLGLGLLVWATRLLLKRHETTRLKPSPSDTAAP